MISKVFFKNGLISWSEFHIPEVPVPHESPNVPAFQRDWFDAHTFRMSQHHLRYQRVLRLRRQTRGAPLVDGNPFLRRFCSELEFCSFLSQQQMVVISGTANKIWRFVFYYFTCAVVLNLYCFADPWKSKKKLSRTPRASISVICRPLEYM